VTKSSQSGYLLKIEVFIPADPREPTAMAAVADVLRMLRDHAVTVGIKDFGDGYISLPNATVSDLRWVARRKSALPAPPSASAEPPATPASAEPPAQEEPAAEESSPSSAAGDGLDIPASLDRRTREALPT